MTKRGMQVVDANILVMGLTFKENCPDIRNTRVIDIIQELKGYHAHVDVYDPWVDKAEAQHEYDITPIDTPREGHYSAVIIVVGHRQFQDMGAARIRELGTPGAILFDVKYVLPAHEVDGRL